MDFEQFIHSLIEEKGLGDQDPEVLAQLTEDLTDAVESRINALILSQLSAGDLGSFEKLLDDGSPEDISAFVQSHIPDFEEKAGIELMTFRTSYLG